MNSFDPLLHQRFENIRKKGGEGENRFDLLSFIFNNETQTIMLSAFAFYFFAALLIFGAVWVIFSRNPVHAVLFLILCFFNASGLFVLLGAEFLAFILAIVYVGAVAVLFLFVVMMLDVRSEKGGFQFHQYVPVGLFVGVVLLVELVMAVAGWTFAPDLMVNFAVPQPEGVDNTKALGTVLYTDYVFAFQIAGLILLVAMIGAISLSLRVRSGVRKQSVSAQVSRKREDVVEVVKITPRMGV